MENSVVAGVFDEIANILDILGENPFRIRSYRAAARRIADMPESVTAMAREGRDLTAVPGIGVSIAEKVREIAATGRCAFLADLRGKIPRGLPELLRIEGLGPKKVKLFHERLGIDSVDRLEEAARSGALKKLPGMGGKSEENLLGAIGRYRAGRGRFTLSTGIEYAESLARFLREARGTAAIEAAGSVRRRRETVGDLDILAISSDGPGLMERFFRYDGIEERTARGGTKSSARLACGLNVDLRVLEEGEYGAALQYFTGSKEHNIALRGRAAARGLKLSEYGVFRGERRVAGRSEEEVYAALGLPVIPPELRENRGELSAAEQGALPDLVELRDIRGDLQMHTTATDGRGTIAEMAEKAKELGYDYIAITEHSKAVRVAGGLDARRLAAHLKAIEKAAGAYPGLRILRGVEVDILPDGSLDLDDGILAECDLVVASVHYRFNLPEKEMTRRIVRAIGNRRVQILGHPTGRLILERPGYEVEMEEVVKAAKEHGVVLEVNAHPSRLDLRDTHVRLAVERGVKLAISTDAHAPSQLDLMRYGVYTARRGWAEAADVINTFPLKRMLAALKR